MARFFIKIFLGPGHPVDRKLHEGDEVAGFKVLDAPGHSAGHVVFWRESDGVLVVGDVLTNMDQLTTDPRPARAEALPDPRPRREPPLGAGRLASLEPKLVLFGHGPPDARHEEVRRLRRSAAVLIDARRDS